MRLKCEVPAKTSGTNVTVRIPVPKATVSGSHEPLGPGQITELHLQDKTYVWKIKKMEGGSEQVLILKVRECDDVIITSLCGWGVILYTLACVTVKLDCHNKNGVIDSPVCIYDVIITSFLML